MITMFKLCNIHVRLFFQRPLRLVFKYQNEDEKLIFRYDNVKHKPVLRFIEHKHTSDGDVVAARSPDLRDLVDEVISCL